MKSDKLKLLLLKIDDSSEGEGELVSLNDEVAKNLLGVFGSTNGTCNGNDTCSGNNSCTNNGICHNNGTCENPEP